MNFRPIFSVTSPNSTTGGIAGNLITVSNPYLTLANTYLTKDLNAGGTTLTVSNNQNFTSADVLLLGNIGQDTSEIVTITGAVTAGTSISLSAATVLNHSRGEAVTALMYDKAVITAATSKNGVYSTIATVILDYGSDSTTYLHANGDTSYWYKVRFFNSGRGNATSDTDAQYAGGYETTSVRYLIDQAKRAVGNTSLDDDFFMGAVNEARRTVNTEFGFGLANAWRAEFNYPVQLLAGTNYVDLPTDIDFTDTNRSILGARFSRVSTLGTSPLRYIDKRVWNSIAYQNTFSYTTADALGNGTATTLTLQSVGDFNTAGGVTISTNKPSQTTISSNYSAINLTTNTLSGLSGLTRSIGTFTVTIAAPGVFTCANHGLVEGDAICFSTTGALPTGINATTVYYVTSTSLTSSTFTVSSTKYGATITTSGSQSGTHTLYNAIPAGTQVWAFTTNAIPARYTVYKSTVNGETKNRLYFEAPIPATLQGRMIYLDYYKTMTDVRAMNDTLDEPWRDAYLDYIKFAIKRRRDDSLGTNDEDFKRFMGAVGNIIGNVYTGQGIIAITG
jgi:hypothetical protein